ncbi:MAG: geranylgeranyl reductase family protein [Thaumarchaeota archaeon]|jgi:geranylgeranyl reductase family protein|nr:geranylgeranyl reductase family protein [Candidatus Terraquivivens yellowstonensis]
MQNSDYDVVVVGAGPAGLLTAREAAGMGCSVLVLEEHEEVGRPEKCAGLFSISGLKMLNVPLSHSYVQNVVRGAVFFSPSGRSFVLDAKRPVAIVSNREMFDKFLAQQATLKGAEVVTGEAVVRIIPSDEMPSVKTSNNLTFAKMVVDAEGRSGFLARYVWKGWKPKGWIPIIQAVVENHQMDKDFVYLYFKEYLKDFFAYLVPIDDNLGKLGVAARKDTKRSFSRFLQEEFKHARILSTTSASIYTGPPLELHQNGKVLAVGDVAGHVKATTGGGVIYGGLCAIETGRYIANFLLKGTGIREYQESMNKIRAQLKSIYRLRVLISQIPPKSYDHIFKAASDVHLDKWLSIKGDMDRHGDTVKAMLKSGMALKLLTRAIFQALKDALGIP